MKNSGRIDYDRNDCGQNDHVRIGSEVELVLWPKRHLVELVALPKRLESYFIRGLEKRKLI